MKDLNVERFADEYHNNLDDLSCTVAYVKEILKGSAVSDPAVRDLLYTALGHLKDAENALYDAADHADIHRTEF